MLIDKKVSNFLDELASNSPTPGGGSVAALAGALGAALISMVGNLTIGKKKYVEVEGEVKELVAKGEMIITALMDLIDQDAAVFEPLSKAYGLPKDTPEQIKAKEEVIEKCCKAACEVPMEIMRKAYEGILVHKRMGEIGTMIAISDVGCGVTFLKSALIAAKLNVLINFNFIKDQEYVAKNNQEMLELGIEGCRIADETLQLVTNKITAK